MNAKEKRPVKFPLSGVITAFALCFTLFIYAPYELYQTNQLEFWFTPSQMLPYALMLFAAAFIVICLVLIFLSRKLPALYPWAVAALLIVLLCSWIQGSFLVFHLPAMNGAQVYWGGFPLDRYCSLGLWIVICTLAVILLIKLGREKFAMVSAFASAAVAFILCITLVTLFLTTEIADRNAKIVPTDENLFTYSTDKNFLILVLDAVDATAFEQSMARDPHYTEVFEDFTYFGNTVGGYPYSMCSVPLILTGQWYEAQQSFHDYLVESMDISPVLNRVRSEEYSPNFYSTEYGIYAAIPIDSFNNLTLDRPAPGSAVHMCKLLVKMAIIKHAPWDLKRFGYDLPGRLNESISLAGDYEYYDWSDLSFYKRIAYNNPIDLSPDKQFKYLHLEGAHEPHQYDKDFNVLPSSPYRDVIEANIKMLDTFFTRLKESGVYNNTAIVVMSDHGSHNDTDLVNMNQHPILFVKGFNEHHALETNDLPVSYDNLQGAFANILDGAAAADVFDLHEGDNAERRFMDYNLENSGYFTEYVQKGHAEDMTTIVPTGRIFELRK